MTNEVEYPPEQSAISLVNGILSDLHDLLEQQLQLTRYEIEEEFRKRSAAAAIFALGIAFVFLHAFVLCLTLANLLHWTLSPAGTDPGQLPLWACQAVIALVLSAIGCGLLLVGRARFQAIQASHNSDVEKRKEQI